MKIGILLPLILITTQFAHADTKPEVVKDCFRRVSNLVAQLSGYAPTAKHSSAGVSGSFNGKTPEGSACVVEFKTTTSHEVPTAWVSINLENDHMREVISFMMEDYNERMIWTEPIAHNKKVDFHIAKCSTKDSFDSKISVTSLHVNKQLSIKKLSPMVLEFRTKDDMAGVLGAITIGRVGKCVVDLSNQ